LIILTFLTLIIPAHNHYITTARCLATIFKSDLKDYKVVVIDDACTDFTNKLLYRIQEEGRPLEVLHNQIQVGYVDSTNSALKKLDTEYFVFMNNDVLLDPICIRELIAEQFKHPEYGILGGTQYDREWKEQAPLKYFVRGEQATISNHIIMKNLPEKYGDIIPVDDTHFACSLCSKRVLDKVGLIDTIYSPGNYDQEDYCLRVLEAGFKIGIVPKAKYIHNASTTTSDNMAFYSQVLDRNRIVFWNKWGDKLRQNKI
jgi:O-antigen biosynthesis protein